MKNTWIQKRLSKTSIERTYPVRSMAASFNYQSLRDWVQKITINKPKEEFVLMHGKSPYMGNLPLFWSKKGGYTQRVDDFKLFTEEQADAHIKATKSSHNFKKFKFEELNLKRTVDMQDFLQEKK